jgi:hypothetical protein
MRCGIILIGVLTVSSASPASPQNIDVTALQMKACTLIKDDTARVHCYDHAMSRPTSEPAMVDVGSEPPLVIVSPSPTTEPRSPTINPEFSTATPQSSSTTKLSPAPDTSATTKSDSSSIFDISTIIRAISPSAATVLTRPGVGKIENWQVKADKSVLEQASRLSGTLKSADGTATLVLNCNAKGAEAYVSTSSFLGWESMRVLYRINDNPVIEARWAASANGSGAVANNAVEFINGLADDGTLLLNVFDYNGTNHDLRFNLGTVSSLRAQIATVCRWPTVSSNGKAVMDEPKVDPRSSKPKAQAPQTPVQRPN